MGLLDLLSNLIKDPGGDVPEPVGDPVRLAELEAALERIRPALRSDGGDIHAVEIKPDGEVVVRLRGACASCHAQSATLLQLVGPELERQLDWVTSVRTG